MVIGETNASESGNNNFYGVLDEELHAQYPMERKVWLFKCRWYDTDVNKSKKHTLKWYKSLNTSRFLFIEESVILVMQVHQVFELYYPKMVVIGKLSKSFRISVYGTC